MYHPMTRSVILTHNVTWVAWAPSTSHDTLQHIFETNLDGIADREDDIKDIEWADGRPTPHIIPDDDTVANLPAGRTTQPDVEMIPEHLAGRRYGDRPGTNGKDSEDDEAGRMLVEKDNGQEDNDADNNDRRL
jgi:hypothetical protein